MSGAGYFTPTGLEDLQAYESSGNPTAQNSTSTASGLYGFLDSTWNEFAPQAGVDTSVYPTAASAPAAVQTQVASITPANNWLCTGCDAGITSDVATNPSLLSGSPMSSGTSFSAPGSFNDNSGSFTGGGLGVGDSIANSDFSSATPVNMGVGSIGDSIANSDLSSAAGLPDALAAAGAAPASGSSWWTEAEAAVENFATRGALILVGIVLLAAAAFALSRKGELSSTVRAGGYGSAA